MNTSRRSYPPPLELPVVERKIPNWEDRTVDWLKYRTALEILNVVQKNYVPKLQNIVIDGVKIEPPKPLPFYPEQFAWQVNAPRLVVKKSPEFQEFHKFIVTETEAVI